MAPPAPGAPAFDSYLLLLWLTLGAKLAYRAQPARSLRGPFATETSSARMRGIFITCYRKQLQFNCKLAARGRSPGSRNKANASSPTLIIIELSSPRPPHCERRGQIINVAVPTSRLQLERGDDFFARLARISRAKQASELIYRRASSRRPAGRPASWPVGSARVSQIHLHLGVNECNQRLLWSSIFGLGALMMCAVTANDI